VRVHTLQMHNNKYRIPVSVFHTDVCQSIAKFNHRLLHKLKISHAAGRLSGFLEL
jgi:hypothetical protein